MKKVYEAPDAKLFAFLTQDILTASGEPPLIRDNEKVGNSSEIGKVTIF